MAVNPTTGADDSVDAWGQPTTGDPVRANQNASRRFQDYIDQYGMTEGLRRFKAEAASGDYNPFTDTYQGGGAPRASAADEAKMKSYRDALYAAVMEPPGSAAYQQGDYYKTLQNDVTELMRKRGWEAGNAAASRGVMTPGSYGAGRIGAGEQTEMETRLRQAASGQAQQAWSQEQVQHINSMLQAAGFEKGLADTKFQEWYMQEALRNGISQAEAQATLAKWQMILQGAGDVLGLAALYGLYSK